MKKTRLLALLLALVMVVALFAACGDVEPEETTTAATTTEATTTEATTTEATTTEATTTEATTEATTTEPEGINLEGYHFTYGDGHLQGLQSGDGASTAVGQELIDGIAAIEEKLNCVIEFTNNGASDDMEKIATLAVGGGYGLDLIKARQSTWIPATVAGYLVSFSDLAADYGLNLENEALCNQTYLKMSELNGEYMAIDFTGKFQSTALGHFYAFNGDLANAAGTSSEQIYQAIRDFEWDYEMFLEIAGAITEDTDSDGQYDVWGVALDTDGNEAWTNGTGPIVLVDGKWTANLLDPNLLPSLEFMYELSGNDMQIPVFGDTVGRGDRRNNFYSGICGFAGLYGGNVAEDGTGSCQFDLGVAPIPHGPNATTYMMNVVDCDWMIMMANHPAKDKAAAVINELGVLMTDWDAYVESLLVNLNYSEECMEIINDYLIPNGKMNIAKCSENMYQITRKQFYSDIYKLEKTAGQAAEAYQSLVQAELDLVFGY